MTNKRQAKARRVSMAERANQMQKLHFPDVPKEWLWDRNSNHGFTTAPRTLPLAMHAIDEQTKGMPAGHTLFCLWARSPDRPLVTIDNPLTFAAEAGFDGKRAVDTWRRRMKKLRELGFIQTQDGASGDFHYVLLLNPNSAMHQLHKQGKVQKVLYGRFMDRMAEIGAMDELEDFEYFLVEQEEMKAAAESKAKTEKADEPAKEMSSSNDQPANKAGTSIAKAKVPAKATPATPAKRRREVLEP